MKSLEELRAIFSRDVFATQAGIVLERADKEGVVCSVALREDHQNAIGQVQGGMIFTLADFAFAVLANIESLSAVTLTSTIQFISAPRGSALTATAVPIREGRSVSFCRVEIRDDTGILVAEALMTGARKPQAS